MILRPARDTEIEILREKEIERQREGGTHRERKEHRERQRQKNREDYGHLTLYYYTIAIVLFYYLSLSCLAFLMTSL